MGITTTPLVYLSQHLTVQLKSASPEDFHHHDESATPLLPFPLHGFPPRPSSEVRWRKGAWIEAVQPTIVGLVHHWVLPVCSSVHTFLLHKEMQTVHGYDVGEVRGLLH